MVLTMRTKTPLEKLSDLRMKLSYDVVKQPADVKQMRTRIIVRNIVFNLLFSIFAFSLKGAQLAIQRDLPILAIALLALYFMERVVDTVYSTYADLQEDNFKQVYTSSIISIVMELTSKVRNKVFKRDEEKGIANVMAHPEVIQKSKVYIDDVWNFWWSLPVAIANGFILIVMIVITIAMELQEASWKETLFIIILLISCTIIYFLFGKKRIEVMKLFRRKRKENEAREEILYSEIKTIEFSSNEDFRYHALRFKAHSVESKKVLGEERLKLNSVFIKRSAVASGFMIAILAYKIIQGGSITEDVILSVVAMSSVYSTILNRITTILQYVEDTVNYVVDIDKVHSDFANIHEVYVEELNKNYETSEVDKIELNRFEFAYDERKTWQLINESSFDLGIGEVILVQGETGCGKSTLGLIIEGGVRMPASPIRFSNGDVGYLKTLTYKTDRSMADNYILSEIILNDDYSKVNKAKLMEILEGLDLKRVFLEFAKQDGELKRITSEEEAILGLMKIRTYGQFSSGQKQRIALAKLLYTLDKSIQIIWLDEAFNRLNDETAKNCVEFILDFVQRDRKRLVMMASHQVDIIRPFCTKEISFERSLTGDSVIKLQQKV